MRTMHAILAASAALVAGAVALAPGAGAGDALKVSCYAHADSSASARVRVAPRRCGFVPRDESIGSGADVRKLRWKNWGGSKTGGRGVVRIATGVKLKTAVKLSKPQALSCGRVYTRARITLEGGASRAVALKNC